MDEKFTKNSIYRLKITDITNQGMGVARLGGMVVFVQNGCTGDEADVKIIKTAKNYLVGRIENLIVPSPFRCEPGCPVSKRCGGCVYRNVTYEHELELKKRLVEAEFRKNHLDLTVGFPLHGDPDGYRNKAQYPIGRTKDGKIAIGFYAQKTHEIVDMRENCRLQPEIFGEIVEFTRKFLDENEIEPYDELTGKGIIRHLYLRRSETEDRVMVCLVAARKFGKIGAFAERIMAEIPKVVSVWLNINPKSTNVVLGKEYEKIAGGELVDRILNRKFTISPASFWQVNRKMCEVLYNVAGELADIKTGEKVLDLYCGIGSVGQSICPPGAKLIGVEIVPEAVENARKNAVANGFSDAEYYCVDATDEEAMGRELERIGGELDVILLDPPRSGCSPELLRKVRKCTTARIVYISCGPDTLARDLYLMKELGYEISGAKTVDLFPRTGHVETVVLLSRETNPLTVEVRMEVETGEVKEHPTYKRIQR